LPALIFIDGTIVLVEVVAEVAGKWLVPSPLATKYRNLPGAGCTAASSEALPGIAIGVGGRPARR
jgi:hypothetical protein